jgi:hypothetical protein
MSDADLVALASKELEAIGLAGVDLVQSGYVVRMPKAYPVYDEGYRSAVETVRRWLAEEVPNVHAVGRNGMHKYNNQDHSMYTAMLTVENILGTAEHDIWAVNVEEEYQEETTGRRSDTGSGGTGRDAPVFGAPPARRAPARAAEESRSKAS